MTLLAEATDGPPADGPSPADAFAHALAYLMGQSAPATPADASGGWLLDWGREWCAARGVGLIVLPIVLPLPVLLSSLDTMNPGQPFLLGGSSETRPTVDHVVACESGRIACDLGGKGISGPSSSGHFFVAYVSALSRRRLH